MRGHSQVFWGNHQIAVLDASTEEADGPGWTVENHCYYGHTVGASFGRKKKIPVSRSFVVHSPLETKEKRQCW